MEDLKATTYPQVMTASNVSHPQAFSFIFACVCLCVCMCVCVCVCVTAVALPPEKTDSCCVEEKMQERDGQSPAGPQKQLQFEVSVNTEQDVYYFPLWMKLGQWRDTQCLTHTHTHTQTHTFILDDTNISPLCCFQELECAVSVEEDNRQEWTFTLYDFDNNGKVTREVTIFCCQR